MRIAVISDIHSNKDAFSAVLKDIDASHVDGIVSLGDNIGYGPEPEAVVHMLREREIPSVLGNHELALKDDSCLKWFNPSAREALEKNISLLSTESLLYLNRLQPFFQIGRFYYVHGFPPASQTIYFLQVEEAAMVKAIDGMRSNICFVGHTHDFNMAFIGRSVLIRRPLDHRLVTLDRRLKYMVNVGSVGQPRGIDKRAQYAIMDDEAHTLDVRFVDYDPQETVQKIVMAGIPYRYAQSLLPCGADGAQKEIPIVSQPASGRGR